MQLWIGGYGPESSAHGLGLATFRDIVEAETDRVVRVRVTWNIMDEGRPNTDLFDLVESGEMFMCYFSSSYLGDRVPELNVIETPFLFDDLEHAHRALDGLLGARLAEAVRSSTGFEVLGFWDNGFRHLTNRLRPVHSPEDCRGMKVRMQPNDIHEELIRCWGATPVAVELSEAIRIISNLEVDAQENPLANTAAYGVDKVHAHVTMTGHLYGTRGLWSNRETLEGLPDDLREIVTRAAAEAVAVQRDEAGTLESALRKRFESQGLRFVDLDPARRDAFRKASAPAIDKARALAPPELYDLAAA
ncbi:MAG TPA: TRAP transporter substrate-binding protein [Acidimicrobiia bacterium]|jgi:TRAP-type C4-dicarboxylate transport system substrate-binding protein|nr:TRAP transporter substrate-binding protein [Acidimicrobiia bacterium]